MTRTQLTTIILCGAYLVWEFGLLAEWKSATHGPHIRIDLLLILPVLAVFVTASAWQFFRSRK